MQRKIIFYLFFIAFMLLLIAIYLFRDEQIAFRFLICIEAATVGIIFRASFYAKLFKDVRNSEPEEKIFVRTYLHYYFMLILISYFCFLSFWNLIKYISLAAFWVLFPVFFIAMGFIVKSVIERIGLKEK